MRYSLKFFIAMMLLLGHLPLAAQEEKVLEEIAEEDGGPSLGFGADLMSRYVWRGIDFGNSPAIQPNITFNWGGFTLGAWGSYALGAYTLQIDDTTLLNMGHYSEADLFVSYTHRGFTLMVFDYFTVNGLNPNSGNRYFDYRNATTGHTLEGILSFEGPEKFPVQLMVSTLFYGADKTKDSLGVYGNGTENNYSTYFEAGYNFHFSRLKTDLRAFIGGIPFGSSWYGPYAGIINAGITAKREIPLTSLYALPVQVSVIANPQAENLFIVFGISL